MDRLRLAFVKFGGLAAGGTERWLQMIAANLPPEEFGVDYFYCDAAPYIGSAYAHANTDPARLRYMQEHRVSMIKFSVGAKDVGKPTHDWVDTDFWQKFDATRYDYVQTGKAGPAEYPFHRMPIPVVEAVALNAGVDTSDNLAWSFLLSQAQRRQWVAAGGNRDRSSVVPVPVLSPASERNLRLELGIPDGALVAGFHQRVDDGIFSPVPLNAFAMVFAAQRHFVIMGGSRLYREQAADLRLRNMHFIEHTGDEQRISEFLNSLDIFAHGRRDGETFGTALAEAMMHGKPCVSHPSLVGSNNAQRETMGPGGIFAENIGEYAEALDALFRDDRLRVHLSGKAQSHAEKYFSLPACIQKVVITYRKLAHLGGIGEPTGGTAEYVLSPLGFLQVAGMDTPPGIPNPVAGRGAPSEFELRLVQLLAKPLGSFVDIGANDGSYCLAAAQAMEDGAKIVAFESRRGLVAGLRESVDLNNWEDRLRIRSLALGGPEPESIADESEENESGGLWPDTLDHQARILGLNPVDFVRIGQVANLPAILEGAAETFQDSSPILFLDMTRRMKDGSADIDGVSRAALWLREHHYSIFESVGRRLMPRAAPEPAFLAGGKFFCFPAALRRRSLEQARAWATRYRVHSAYSCLLAELNQETRRAKSRLGAILRNPTAHLRAALHSITTTAAHRDTRRRPGKADDKAKRPMR